MRKVREKWPDCAKILFVGAPLNVTDGTNPYDMNVGSVYLV